MVHWYSGSNISKTSNSSSSSNSHSRSNNSNFGGSGLAGPPVTYVHRIRTRKNPVKCTTWVPICFKKSPSLICPEHLRPFRRTFLRTHTVTGSPSPPDWYKIDIDSIDALYQICQTATENVTFFCWSKASGKDK